jgi:hypothetical protein
VRIIENMDNPNFIFYTPTVPLARQTEKYGLLTHFPLHRWAYMEFF